MNYNKMLKKDLIALLEDKDETIDILTNGNNKPEKCESQIEDLEDKIRILEEDLEISKEDYDRLNDLLIGLKHKLPFVLPTGKLYVEDIKELSDYELEELVDLLNEIKEYN